MGLWNISRFETSQRTSFSWDKMLLDDLAYEDGQTPPGKFKRAFARCKPSEQTKLVSVVVVCKSHIMIINNIK